MAPRHQLTEEEKIDLLKKIDLYPGKWTLISSLTGIPPSTIKSFHKSYSKHHILFPKRGPKPTITTQEKNEVLNFIEIDPELSLADLESMCDISKSSIYDIFKSNSIKYTPKVPVSSLTETHQQKRIEICQKFADIPYSQMPFLVFTDESTVMVDLEKGGIWRKKGVYPPEAFYVKQAHPIQVMVWGAIGPRGYRSKLVHIKGNMNSESYIKMLNDNQIFEDITAKFGNNWLFQQDNAPPHSSRWSKNQIVGKVPGLIDWPSKSPDLSPIEHIWDYLKSRVAGVSFSTEEALFNRLSFEWNNIPIEIIHNSYSSFKARCQVILKIQGKSLNGHWKEVKEHHNQYRTKISLRYNFITNSFEFVEINV